MFYLIHYEKASHFGGQICKWEQIQYFDRHFFFYKSGADIQYIQFAIRKEKIVFRNCALFLFFKYKVGERLVGSVYSLCAERYFTSVQFLNVQELIFKPKVETT